jgi:hypothetical protein
MLDLVPLARPRRKVTDPNRQADLIGQSLQFNFPQADSTTIAAATVCCDHQLLGLWVGKPAYRLPPPPNGLHGKSRRIVVGADADPACIRTQVIDTVWIGPPQFLIDEVINVDFFRLTLCSPGLPRVLEGPDQLFFLRVH